MGSLARRATIAVIPTTGWRVGQGEGTDGAGLRFPAMRESYRCYRCRVLGLRQGFPPRNSKCCSLTTDAMDSARPSHGIRANWRAESQAALYQTPGLRPG